MTLARRFFSAPTLTRALLDAARHHGVDPEQLAYEVIEKKTGFVKSPRGVLIEVDPDQPTGAAGGATAVAPPTAPPDPQAVEASPATGAADDRDHQPTVEPPSADRDAGDRVVADDDAVDDRVADDEARDDEAVDAYAVAVDAEVDDRVADRAAATDADAGRFDEVDTPAAVTDVDVELPVAPEIAPPSPALAAATHEAVDDGAATDATSPAPPPSGVELPVEPATEAAVDGEWESDGEAVDRDDEVADSDDEVSATHPAPAERQRMVAEAIDELAHFAGLRVQATAVEEGEDSLLVEVDGPDAGRLVAKGGRALLAMQHLLPRLLFHQLGKVPHCRLDSQGFHASRRERLTRAARKAADRVRDSGRPWMLEPMAPDERRLVHLALADDEEVTTQSVGDGFLRRVRVSRISDDERR